MTDAKLALSEWLVRSGKLREMYEKRKSSRSDNREAPWRHTVMAIFRFSIPCNVYDKFRQASSQACSRQAMYQGRSLTLDCSCVEILTEREVEQLFRQYCS